MSFLDKLFKILQTALFGGSSSNQPQQNQQVQGQYPGQQPQPYFPQPQNQYQSSYPPLQQQDYQNQQQTEPPKPHHQHSDSASSPKPPKGGQPFGQGQTGYAPDSHNQSPPPAHGKQHHEDPDQVNQHNAHYVSLRAKANEEGDQMARCFDQSHEAYSRGDGAKAKELSNQGKEHQRNMENLNQQASDWIFTENNKDSHPGEIDLHGLYVKEAISRTDRAIGDAKRRGDSEVHLIVGKGLHSQGGHAKIKPAIEDLMHKHSLVAELDSHNAGVLIVHLDGRGPQNGGGVGVDEISRCLSKGDDENCVIM